MSAAPALVTSRDPEPDPVAELRASLVEVIAYIQAGALPDDAWVERTAFLLARTDNRKGH